MKLLSAALYPVKSMRAVKVSALTLDEKGVVGDRRWMVVDAENRFVTQRSAPGMARFQPELLEGGLRIDDGAARLDVELPRLEGPRRTVTLWRDTFATLDAGDEAAAWLGARLGFACRLVAFASDVRREVDVTWAKDAQTTFTDAYPLLIVNEASLDTLNAKLPAALPMDRFRPNLVVRASAPWVEDGWTRVEVDGLPLDAVKPCARCVTITTDQFTGEKPQGSLPLTVLTGLNSLPGMGALFGMNLVHRAHGTLRVGAQVAVN
ncbi:MAG: MOSC N-terminal beta barrel domain-containing protein [Archangium sp.]|nr:MOSC N-terminal beta barrel domain-containing protein [Archangium sp.]MDP3152783.1 MOSC N-terminal beta barrel domain-containing protein [Archangium sp.]MDP3573570.1 MOSC N-terminal beta barrel domain-containing protein [Archangium sp.]